MQRNLFLSTRVVFSPSDESASPSVDVQHIAPHAANAPSVSPEPTAAQPVVSIETVSAITDADAAKRAALAAKLQAKRQAASTQAPTDKPANAANAAKRVNGKRKQAATPTVATPAKPTADARAQAQRERNDETALARAVALACIGPLYTVGSSMPFKAAGLKLKPLNGASRVCKPSARTAALALALVTYGAPNGASIGIQPNGSFVRTGLRAPARLFDAKAPADKLVSVQPESGCIADRRGDLYAYAGEASYNPQAVISLNVANVLREIGHGFGDKQRNAALAMLCDYGVRAALAIRAAEAKPAKLPTGRAKPKAA